MKFSIITPSFRSSEWLKLCIASVADQTRVEKEHIVQDNCSDDGTAEWLASDPRVRAFMESDSGMYDAINRGLKRATGDVFAFLNCDEQYLPGALANVHDFFAEHPNIDIVFGHVLVIRPDGSLLAFRKAYPVYWPVVAVDHLYALSCGMFFRRRIIDNGISFDGRLRDVGDADFVIRVLRAGYRTGTLPAYVAAFALTGQNMFAKPNARAEVARMRAQATASLRLLHYPLKICRRVERFVCGACHQDFPLTYAVYTHGGKTGRRSFTVSTASFRWPKEITP